MTFKKNYEFVFINSDANIVTVILKNSELLL